MNDLNIKTKLIKCIKDTCAYDEDIKEIDNLKNDLGYDSLEIVSLIFEIEETFGINLIEKDGTYLIEIKNPTINGYLKSWNEEKNNSEFSVEAKENYAKWKSAFPKNL